MVFDFVRQAIDIVSTNAIKFFHNILNANLISAMTIILLFIIFVGIIA